LNDTSQTYILTVGHSNAWSPSLRLAHSILDIKTNVLALIRPSLTITHYLRYHLSTACFKLGLPLATARLSIQITVELPTYLMLINVLHVDDHV